MLEGLTLGVERTLYVPAYDSVNFLREQQEHAEEMGWTLGGRGRRRVRSKHGEEEGGREGGREDGTLFSLLLEDPSLPGLPLTEVAVNRPYALYLRGMSPSGVVRLQLLLRGRDQEGEQIGRQGEVRRLGSVKMDGWGNGREDGEEIIFIREGEQPREKIEGNNGRIVVVLPDFGEAFALQAVDTVTGTVGFSPLLMATSGGTRRSYGTMEF